MLVKTLLWIVVLFCLLLLWFSITGKGRPETDQQHTNLMLLLIVLVIALSGLTGCSTIRPDGVGTEWKHDSVLLRGAPFTDREIDGQKVEDSLDVWNNYLYWDRPAFYAEIGLGLKVREGGFYSDGSPFIVNARVGKRFRFGQ